MNLRLLLQVPQEPDTVWVGWRCPWRQLEAAFWVDRASRELRAATLCPPADRPELLWDSFEQAVLTPYSLGRAQRPAQVLVEEPIPPGLSLEPSRRKLPAGLQEEALLKLEEAFEAPEGLRYQVDPGVLASFFRVAAEFFRREPWEQVSEDDPFRVLLASAVLVRITFGPRGAWVGGLQLDYGDLGRLGTPLLRDALEHGWDFVDSDHLPRLRRRGRPAGVRSLETATRALQAVLCHLQGRPPGVTVDFPAR